MKLWLRYCIKISLPQPICKFDLLCKAGKVNNQTILSAISLVNFLLNPDLCTAVVGSLAPPVWIRMSPLCISEQMPVP